MTTRYKILFAIPALISCALAQAETEQRDLADFTAIVASDGINVDVRIGEVFLVEVDTDEDVDDIITEVKNGRLYVRVDRDFFESMNWMDDYNASVVLPVLTGIEASGGVDVFVRGTVTGDELKLEISGGSDMEIDDVAVERLDITTSGGSDLQVSGTANTVIARLGGGSDLDAKQLNAKEADLRASGASDIVVSVIDTLYARASGASDIDYYGNPEMLDSDVSGASDITRHQAQP